MDLEGIDGRERGEVHDILIVVFFANVICLSFCYLLHFDIGRKRILGFVVDLEQQVEFVRKNKRKGYKINSGLAPRHLSPTLSGSTRRDSGTIMSPF